MKYIYSFIWLILIGFCNFFAQAQTLIPTGTWRTHLTYHNAKSLALTDDKVYVVSENGLFYVDKKTKETFIITKLDGLHDNQFSKIAYHKTLKKLIIAYKNGNIDILTEKNGQREIVNINDIFLTNRLISKQINQITLSGNLAYLSMASGVVVIDLEKNKIFENYLQLGNVTNNISPTINVYASAVLKDSIFLATENGILAASLSQNLNRQDPANWKLANFTSNKQIRFLATKNNKLYYYEDNIGISEYDNVKVIKLAIPLIAKQNFLNLISTSNQQNLMICATGLVMQIDLQNAVKTFKETAIISPQEADNQDNTIWIADSGNGLLDNASGVFNATYPKGIFHNSSFDLLYFQEKILSLSGAYNTQITSSITSLDAKLGFSVFDKGEWINYNANKILKGIITTPDVKNVVQAAYNLQENKVYLATFSDGLLVFDVAKNEVTKFATPTLPTQQISALTVDRTNNLWIVTQTISGNNTTNSAIYKLENNTWKLFPLANLGENETPLQVLADDANNIWLRIRKPNGQDFLMVLNDKNQQKTFRTFTGTYQYAGNQLNAMDLDKDGNLWLGGNKGVRILNSAASALTRSSVELNVVRFEQRQLFLNEPISAIKTDGGNRKWIGTEKGVWLFSSSGAEQILHFTAENSPLLANSITAIEIQQKTGEVFFATPNGLISYRGDATAATEEFSSIKIFPNPIPPNFQGIITIEGLAMNSNVKITDISGRLVYETQAQGGTATWNGADYTGRRANSGIYLVFCTNQAGEQSLVGKLAIVE
jgi:hypothetical protein